MTDTGEKPVYAALVRLKPEKLSLGGWASKAGLARNAFNYIREHGNPKSDTLQALLDVAGVSRSEFAALVDEAAGEHSMALLSDPFNIFRHGRPRDVPVRGTPSCGDIEVDGEQIETVEMDLGETVDYVRRPASLDGRKDVYAIYFTGYSMEPRFEQGEVAYVDTKRPPAIGDYVVVQLKHQRSEGEDPRIVHALVKRLVRQSSDWIELEQFNRPLIFKIERKRVATIHRIIPLSELVSF